MTSRARAMAGALAVLIALGCARGGDPVLATVEAARRAAEERDTTAFAALLADDFRGSGGIDKAEAVATLRRFLAGYESVSVSVYDVQAGPRTDTEGALSCLAEFNGSARKIGGLEGFLPPSAVYRFDLRLARRGEAWTIVGAEWRSVEPPGSASP